MSCWASIWWARFFKSYSIPRPRAVQGPFRSCAKLLIVASTSNVASEAWSESSIDSLFVHVVASRLQFPFAAILSSDSDCKVVLWISKEITIHMKILLVKSMDCDCNKMRLILIEKILIAKLMESAILLQPFTDNWIRGTPRQTVTNWSEDRYW